MTPPNPLTRRQFLRTSTRTATAVAAASTLAPNLLRAASKAGTVRVGCIGLGTRGGDLINAVVPLPDVTVTAVCDVYGPHRQKGVERSRNPAVKAYVDYRELLADPNVDAVIIATPDHWHALPVVQAARAKKDIYCEKPLSLTIREARVMANAVRENNVVFQTGSMQRSDGSFWKGCTLVRNGMIGEIKEVYANVGGPSQWCDLPEEPMEPGLDWNEWLGQAPVRPYNSVLSPRGVHDHFPNWRSYREYSGGGMTDWGAHHFDIAQWGLGMDESGPVEIIPPNGRDVKRLTYLYKSGVKLIHGGLEGYNFGVVFVGTKGKVCVDRGRFSAEPAELEKVEFDKLPVQLYRSRNHYRDFTSCIASRQRPICDVEVGARSVTVCHLGNLAYWNKRALKWDPARERFIGDEEANTWLDREKRDPYKV
ncbi:MAG: Gfo/Idh/MocA family oxidoreductase [Verrucomicrobiae bacterium]|nr:Gfo/Idh/MocA family oxidoreductase [Verrucomicrobiae bacterium]